MGWRTGGRSRGGWQAGLLRIESYYCIFFLFQVALALTCRKQEAIKMEMEESLQPREIKMIVPSKSVKL